LDSQICNDLKSEIFNLEFGLGGRGAGRGTKKVTFWVDILPKTRILGLYVYPKGKEPPGTRRKQLVKEATKWRRLAAAGGWALGPEAGEGLGDVLAKTQAK
jgi:hypothetical protein